MEGFEENLELTDPPCPKWICRLEHDIGQKGKEGKCFNPGGLIMFDRSGLVVSDLDETLRVYEACLEPLSIDIDQRQPQLPVGSSPSQYP